MERKLKRTPGRPPKSTGADPQTESRLLQTAAGLFMERGYEQVSLELIAEACQVTKATVYYYFTNKSRLFTEAVVYVLRNAKEVTLRLLEEPVPFRDRLVRIATGHLSVNRADFPTMMKEAGAHLSAEQLEQIRSTEQAIHSVMADAFRAAASGGELRALSPIFLSHAFSALLMLGNRKPVMDAYGSPEEAARHIVSLFMDGAAQE
ncbi:TetR/AcrR family transcriptional regulator [Gorillibacterium sp. sgz5001074]|uniref:TetR/AcrR family transcriptional regulator n=1 Tax=Gorillibacterium sp. sgz5001074 TaxID=3446695 RepID=UPI003F67A08B